MRGHFFRPGCPDTGQLAAPVAGQGALRSSSSAGWGFRYTCPAT